MTEVMEVHPDLVGPAAVQDAFDEADLVAGTKDAILGFRGAALASRDAHPLAVHGMARDGFVDHSGLLPQNSGNERQINLCHRPRGKLAGQIAMGGVVLRDDEHAASFLVETVHDAGTFLSANAGKILAVGQERIHQSVPLMAGAWMHNNSGRLVQDEEIVILENDVEFYRFRLRFNLLDLRFPQLDEVAGPNKVSRPWRFPIKADESIAD
jgi:hypothetical protein